METVTCTRCGKAAKLKRRSVECVRRIENGAQFLVVAKTTIAYDCPNCGEQIIHEPGAPNSENIVPQINVATTKDE